MPDVVVSICNPRIPPVRWEVETGESLETCELASLGNDAQRQEQDSFAARWKVRTDS